MKSNSQYAVLSRDSLNEFKQREELIGGIELISTL